ncbi:hypothetical protein CHEID_02935 [Corynebacterium heidelbergense]|nr:hypothetical protein CHEID_02935 [Corynebacterium heidelbergense]
MVPFLDRQAELLEAPLPSGLHNGPEELPADASFPRFTVNPQTHLGGEVIYVPIARVSTAKELRPDHADNITLPYRRKCKIATVGVNTRVVGKLPLPQDVTHREPLTAPVHILQRGFLKQALLVRVEGTENQGR